MYANIGDYQAIVDEAMDELRQQTIRQRIWKHDHTVWKPEPTEISNRLGWLHSPEVMQREVERLQQFATAVHDDGLTHVLLLGMGGSSLAPELFYKTFGGDGLPLTVLDSTDPGAIRRLEQTHDLEKTLFIVATKSGGTVETLSFFKYFYTRVAGLLGGDQAGSRFVAITDPGSKLEAMAQRFNFRDCFLNDPNIGGRYSALSFFGLLPAALVGVDVAALLARAQQATQDEACARLGVIMSELAKAGRDKVTLVTSEAITSFGDWVEQLIAESTGKEGTGILPVVGEPLGPPGVYGDDRLFVHLQLAGDKAYETGLLALAAAGHPVVILTLQDIYDIGGQFFCWEMATAVAGHRLGIQPFDQPNVESAKVLARKMVAAYTDTGTLPERDAAELTPENLHHFLSGAKPGDYVALQAFVPPTPETAVALQTLRLQIRDRYKVATTLGYGPRFLHSTGQLHKGDGGNGLFIQFTSDADEDVPIPDNAGQSKSTMTFGVLKMAQALGDGQALLEANRRFIRFHLRTDVVGGLSELGDKVKG